MTLLVVSANYAAAKGANRTRRKQILLRAETETQNCLCILASFAFWICLQLYFDFSQHKLATIVGGKNRRGIQGPSSEKSEKFHTAVGNKVHIYATINILLKIYFQINAASITKTYLYDSVY